MWNTFHQIIWIVILPFVQMSQAQHPKSASCSWPEFDKKVHNMLSYSVPVIDVDKAYERRDKVVFLDAREWEEYQVSHLPDAIYTGFDDFDIRRLKDIDKNTNIIVYCSIGYRSEKIGQKLKKAGYNNVKNLYGSLFEWVNCGYPVYTSEGTQTFRIHTYNKKWSPWVNSEKVVKVW